MTTPLTVPAVRADDALLTALAAGLVPDPTDALALLLAAWRAEALALRLVPPDPWGGANLESCGGPCCERPC